MGMTPDERKTYREEEQRKITNFRKGMEYEYADDISDQKALDAIWKLAW